MRVTVAYPPTIANAPWARFTNPMRPMVIESPTETMKRSTA